MMRLKFKRFELFMSHNVSTDKFKLRLGGHWFIMYHVKSPDKHTVGVSNETPDGFYVPFIDYDHVKYSKLRREIGILAKRFRLSLLAVLCTYEENVYGELVGNYHVVGIDKLQKADHEALLRMASCDPNFRNAPRYYSSKSWVLRIYPKVDGEGTKVREKPVLKEVIWSGDGIWDQSYAFWKLLRGYYGVRLPGKPGKLDSEGQLRMVEYATGKR